MDNQLETLLEIYLDSFMNKISSRYDFPLQELQNLWCKYKHKTTHKIRLGLCCINTQLRSQKPPIFCSRTMIRKNFTVEKAQNLALQNLEDLCTMISWNAKNKISLFRISSDIFPHFTDRETESYTIDFARSILKRAGD